MRCTHWSFIVLRVPVNLRRFASSSVFSTFRVEEPVFLWIWLPILPPLKGCFRWNLETLFYFLTQFFLSFPLMVTKCAYYINHFLTIFWIPLEVDNCLLTFSEFMNWPQCTSSRTPRTVYVVRFLSFDLCGIFDSLFIKVTHNLQHFAYHCQYAYLNDTLRVYLKSSLPTKELRNSSLRTLWFFFRTLIREVGINFTFFTSINIFNEFSRISIPRDRFMNSTWWNGWGISNHSGPFVTANKIKLMQCVFRRSQNVSLTHSFRKWTVWNPGWKVSFLDLSLNQNSKDIISVAVCLTAPYPLQEEDDVKHQLDTLLMGWTPRTRNLEDLGTDLIPDKVCWSPCSYGAAWLAYMWFQCVASIKHEHNVFSAYTKSFSGNTDAAFSSLVVSDYFIHSYNCQMQGQENLYLSIQTYSRHDNRCYRNEFLAHRHNIVHTALRYLLVNGSFSSRNVILTSMYASEVWNFSFFGPLPKVWIRTWGRRINDWTGGW